ncbi:MAG: hypothetical protein SFU99_11250 [Saprospiraceae bacterium]|nr:hypothetical protein [Saprospiraceae bacterium]
MKTLKLFLILYFCTSLNAFGQRQGLISTFGDLIKITNGFSFSPDGRKLYTSERTSVGKQSGRHVWKTYKGGRMAVTLFEYDLKNGNVYNKRKMSFANDSLDYYPNLNFEGNRIFFVSRRPAPQLNAPDSTFTHIWMAEKVGDHWNSPQYIEALNTIGYHSCYAQQLKDGSVIFISNKPGSKPGPNGNLSLDLWISEWKNGAFQEPINFEFFNSVDEEEQPYMDQTERIFIFKRNFNDESNVFLSIKENGKWREPRQIYLSDFGGYDEHCPKLSRDGKTFYLSYNLTIMHIPLKELLSEEEMKILKKTKK